jgi:hypothetical protein
MARTGLFRRAVEIGALFEATAVPFDFVATCTFTCSHAHTVDWGDGTAISYLGGTTNTAVPTGDILINSVEAVTTFRFNSNTYTSINITASSTVTSLYQSFYFCTKLTSLAIADTSNVTIFFHTFRSCNGLVSFPLIDTSAGTDFASAWRDCSGLETFPILDMISADSLYQSWEGCTGLTTFPVLDTSAVRFFLYAWNNCSNLTSFPALDTAAGTNFIFAFRGCSDLVTIAALDTTNTSGASSSLFSGCTSLTSPDSATQTLLASAAGYDFN